MKKLLTLLMVTLMLFTVGCAPEIPDPGPPPIEIDCDGWYSTHHYAWAMCHCPTCETYPAGTYWVSNMVFLLGDPVDQPMDAIEIYGDCPDSYIEAFEKP